MKMNLLVVCDTLKQAGNLFERYVKLVASESVIKAVKARREIKFTDGVTMRFTSRCHYEIFDRDGFRGKILYGNYIERQLDRCEKSLEKLNQED